MSAYLTTPELLNLSAKHKSHPTLPLSLQDCLRYEHASFDWSELRTSIAYQPETRPFLAQVTQLKLLSLNCGGFGIDSNHFRIDLGYQEECFAKLLAHIREHGFTLVHLQDYPYTPELLERLAEVTGYALRAVPQIFLTHARPCSQDSGLVVLTHPDLKTSEWTYRYHETNVPKVDGYQRELAEAEMIFVNGTLGYTVELEGYSYRLNNTYICPVSTARKRREVFAAEAKLSREYPRYLLTGDTNLYGTNTLRRVAGLLPANPYAFVLNAGSSWLLGRNYPHLRERRRITKLLTKRRLYLANRSTGNSIRFALRNFVPGPLQFLVGNKQVGWLLDLAVTNLNPLPCTLDSEPFGDVDHASLHITLPRFDNEYGKRYN